jgi:hypothetical protein
LTKGWAFSIRLPAPLRHTINLAPSFIFDYPGHFMPTNTTDLEKRLWEAADDLRANSKLKSSE